MNPAIPSPLRAVAGLAAVTIDEAKRLPTRLVGLPVTATSTALQVSLKVQQQYAALINRGDELLATITPAPEHAPEWATFDDEETAAPEEPEVAPLAGYDELTVPQLRGRLRRLSEQQVSDLLDYERSHAARPPYLTMLTNRLDTLRHG